MRRSLVLLFVLACEEEVAPERSARVDPVPTPVVEASPPSNNPPHEEVPAVAEPTKRANDELVFGPSRAAYDLSGWSPPPLPRRRANEEYTASDYDYHYADVPGHPGIRAATNAVTVTLAEGVGREVILRILEAERAEIVGQIPALGFYQLRIPARSFEDGMATAARIRAMEGVHIAAYSPSSYFGVDDGEQRD